MEIDGERALAVMLRRRTRERSGERRQARHRGRRVLRQRCRVVQVAEARKTYQKV